MTTTFQCTRCGECCRIPGQIHLTETDIARMAAFLKLTEQDFIQRHTDLARDRRDLVIKGDPASPCQFLRGNDCVIYPVRPEQCAAYPAKWNNPGWENICKRDVGGG
ncbi:MAG: YkgJ family cysteine cluster protein [Verrucomicrobia bacterium]|nr:YkgJ family cysteine cluster protein [Verrucomicrobiota bacterium]